MTDTVLLKQYIEASGYKMEFIAKELGISRAALYQKINNITEFTASEVNKMCDLLRIRKLTEKEKIFFARKVDK